MEKWHADAAKADENYSAGMEACSELTGDEKELVSYSAFFVASLRPKLV